MQQLHQTINQFFNENKPNQALKFLKKQSKKHSNDPEVERLIAIAYIKLKNFKLAEKHLTKSLSINPYAPNTLLNLASLYKEQGKFSLAITTINQVLQHDPNHVAALFNRGNIYRLMEQWENASDSYEQVLMLNANHLPVLISLGLMKKNNGKIKQAIDLFHRALDIDPFNKQVYLALSNLKNYKFSDNEISILTQIINQSKDEDCIELLFAKAQYLEHQENYQEAFGFLERANQAQYKKIKRKPFDWPQYSERIISTFNHINRSTPSKQQEKTNQPTPLFIVSMPRSGSTLVEQIIASHSAVYGASELATFPHLIKQLEQTKQQPYPEACLDTNKADLELISTSYQNKINSYGASYQYVSDKSLLNFNYIGAILAAMPHSVFIHCSRHPMDVCLSCYKQYFSIGQEYSYDIHELTAYHNHYSKIMQYWKQQFPQQILTVDYEDLVSQTKNKMTEILNFLKLPWEDNCMDFHKTKRMIKTASAAQVTQQIYTQATHRYKKYGNTLTNFKINLNIP